MMPISSIAAKIRRGVSLVELLVATALMFVVFAGVSWVLVTGLSYLRTNQNALNAQSQVLALMSALGRELERSSLAFVDPEATGVVFADPDGGHDDPALGITSQLQSNVFGQLLWQRYVGYYLDTTTNKVYRREVPYTAYPPAAAMTTPPTAGPGVCQTPGTPPLNVTWMASQSTLHTTMVADSICRFECKSVSVVGGTSTVSVINITIEGGDPAKNRYDQYWFRLQTQISPRN